MKFTYALLGLLASYEASAFAPASMSPRTTVESTTSLNAFGINTVKSALFNKPSKAQKETTEEEIRSLFYLWNDALATGDSRIVASRYASDPVLLPTVSDTPRTDSASIKDYFDAFLLKKPQGEIVEGFIKIGDGWAQDNGIYEFTMGVDGSKVKARYTYVYVKEGGKWKISHHHSSILPEGISVAKPITKKEVQNLFHLWNDALATGDSTAVANRYSKEGVLLPTVSDEARTSYDRIKNYFDSFLLKKPQGTILESNVIVGTNWAQDAGIYEFEFGIDGSKVKGRYSFIYVYEDGQWKISHHHSSVMPEALLASASSDAPAISEKEVGDLFNLWNDALATDDPKKVAARYAKGGVLLPTVSDTPRTDSAAIESYFVDFLKKKPQGVITDRNILIKDGICQDCGVYEFTMGVDGSKVLARYTFVYVYEDGEWKIAHHHSSAMPEGLIAASNKLAELEAKA